MAEVKVPLTHFGPGKLYRWVRLTWNDLGADTKAGLRTAKIDRDQIMDAAGTNLYLHLLQRLSDDDFNRFLEWALALPLPGRPRLPYPPGLGQLGETPLSLKKRLESAFPSLAEPGPGFTSILNKALRHVDKASMDLGKLIRVHGNLRPLITGIHGELDQALLAAEHLVGLLLEFGSGAAYQAGIATPEQVERWRRPLHRNAGYQRNWRRKQGVLYDVVGTLQASMSRPPFEWEPFVDSLKRLLRACKGQITNRRMTPLGELVTLLDQLADIRNDVRHASVDDGDGSHVPDSYREAVPKLRDLLSGISELLKSIPLPATARLISYKRDHCDSVELELHFENGEQDTVFFVDEEAAIALVEGYLRRSDGLDYPLPLEQVEYFIFPPLSPARLTSPLLIRRRRRDQDWEPVVLSFPQ